MEPNEVMMGLRGVAARWKALHPIIGVGQLRVHDALSDAADCIEKLQAELEASQRRERAALSDMKVMALAMRESEELSEGCCFACAYDAQNLSGDVILAYGECPGYNVDECFDWRGPEQEGEANHE